MIIDLFPPRAVHIYRENCPLIFSETELLLSKFRNTALPNASESSYSGSGSGKLDWTGRALSQKQWQQKKLPEQLLVFDKWFSRTVLPAQLTPSFFSQLSSKLRKRRVGKKLGRCADLPHLLGKWALLYKAVATNERKKREHSKYTKLEVNRTLRLLPRYVCLIEFACDQSLGLQSKGGKWRVAYGVGLVPLVGEDKAEPFSTEWQSITEDPETIKPCLWST